jgi:protein ImuB
MFACIYSPKISLKLVRTDAASSSIAQFAYAFSPLVEETAPDTVVIDVEGCALLFGSAYELANQIVQQARLTAACGGLGCPVNVALAANPDAAIQAAKFFKGITFIAPGEELTALGDLPIAKLLSPKSQVPGPGSRTRFEKPTLDVGPETLDQRRIQEIIETLKLWGIKTFREFAELPGAGVSERLGQDGLKLQALAAGKTTRHLKLKQPAPVFTNSLELDYPIAQLEALSFILARLLNQICASLHAYALATNALQVELKLETGARHELKLNLPYPMRDHKVFLKLLLLDTELHPPPAAVSGIAINCDPVKPRVLQTGLFIPLAPEPEKLELVLARLAKLVGAENIGSPELLDTHRPDAFKVKRFEINHTKKKKRAGKLPALPASSNQQSELRNPKSILGFRVFRPPLRALVQVEGGCPKAISGWDKNKSVYGKVVGVAGPWRSTGDWWRTDRWARDEWDVAVEVSGQMSPVSDQETLKSRAVSGQAGSRLQVLYRLYRELSSGSWFVEGIYD